MRNSFSKSCVLRILRIYIGRAVAGTLRAGDLVDIKSVIEIKQNVEDTQQNGSVTNVGGVEMEPAQEEEAPIVGLETEEEAVILDMNGNVFTSPSLNLVYGVTGAYAVQTVAENVRVVSVYTVGGETAEQIESAGGTMIATVVNVVVPRSMQDSIYLAMAEGEIQLARVEVKEAAAEESAE